MVPVVFAKTRVLERCQEGIIFLFSLFNSIRAYRVKKSLADCFDALAKVQNALFIPYLDQDYLLHQSYYNKLINTKRRHFLRKTQHARQLVKKNEKYQAVFSKIENLYEIICSLHLLLFRVDEYAIFDICRREMQGIEKESTNLLLALAKNQPIDTQLLFNEVHLFETLFERTLQIVVRDPNIFLFFIQDLYAFNTVVTTISQ